MYYYNSDGDLDFTPDAELARRQHALTMLSARRYPARPEAAGALHRALGYAPVGVSRQEALERVRRVMLELGLSGVPVSDVLEVVDESWRLVIEVGTPPASVATPPASATAPPARP